MNKLTPETTAALFNMLANLGVSVVLAILKGINKPDATIDDAITALETAENKSLEQYKIEAVARLKAEGFTVTPPASTTTTTVVTTNP